jgi:hypothetical protein
MEVVTMDLIVYQCRPFGWVFASILGTLWWNC